MNGTRTLRIGVTQFELRAERSVAHLMSHIEALVAEAVAHGADLVVFPELTSTGLLGALPDHTSTRETVRSDYRGFLASLWDDIVRGAADVATAHGVVLLGGSHIRAAEDGSLRNTAILTRPGGRVELQDKIHLTPPEVALGMRGGDELLVTSLGPFTIGVLICADIEFPELARYLCAKGVDLILNPSLTWNRRGVFRVRNGSNARANENQLLVAMSPMVGSSGLPVGAPIHAVGRALVACPTDKTFGREDGIVAIAESDGEGVIVVEVDRDLVDASRANPETPGLKLQRPDVYAKLSAEIASR